MPDLRESLQTALGQFHTLGRELGGGGMSRVFVATDTRLRREVVVKVLAPELAAGVSSDRFEREIRMAAGLQHPNIVPVLTAGEVDGLPYYMMPLVAGASLRERLGDVSDLRLSQRIEVLRDVARALAYAHKSGIVHRDIKPENILLTDGAAAVTDFGIAKALAASRGDTGEHSAGGTRAALTGLGTSLGTPAYMAPEQAAGDSVDQRADVYSWGIVAWELLAGRHPFADRKTSQQLIMAQLSDVPPRLDTVAPDVSSALASLVARCLEKNQALRPANGGELLAELEAVRTAPPGGAVRSGGKRGMVVAAAAAAAVVAFVLIAGVPWPLRSKGVAADEQVIAVTPFRVAGADPSLHYLREGMLDLVSAKLGGGSGSRAIDPRTLLAAWKRAGGDDRIDLDEAKALAMATSIGAGEVLSGEVVGNAAHLTLTGRIVSTRGARTRAQGSVEGPADSLTTLVDRLCAKLLSLRAGVSERSLAELTSASLPALRHYLEGRQLYRRGNFVPAGEEFTKALEADSNFVHPAIGLAQIGRWGGAFRFFRPGADAVFRLRSKLSPGDRLIADVIIGDGYPKDPPMAERLRAADRWAAADPQSVEAIGHQADVVLHFGQILGIEDANERARDGFLRVMAMDSTYLLYFSHLPYLFAEMGDTVALRRLAAMAEADTSLAKVAPALRVLEANARGDAKATDDLLSRISSWELRALNQLRYPTFNAVCARCVDAVMAELAKRKLTPAQVNGLKVSSAHMALLRGQPSRSASFERQLAPFSADLVRYAFADGDSALADETAIKMEENLAKPARESTWRAQISALFGIGVWAGAHGDTVALQRAITRLRALQIGADSLDASEQRDRSALALSVELSTLGRHSDLPRLVASLDSSQAFAPIGGANLAPPSAFILSRAYERLGDNRKALRAVLQVPQQWGAGDYHVTQMRQAGRLAAALGEREKALEYYRWYLAYRANPEPPLREERDVIRKAVADLESKRR